MAEDTLRTPKAASSSPRRRLAAGGRLDLMLWRGMLGPLGVALVLLASVGLLLQAAVVLASAVALPPLGVVFEVLLGLAPAVLELALPLAFLASLVVLLGRWHDDGTWIALRACGIGGRQVLRPALLGALAIALPLLVLSHGLAPAGRRAASARLVQACTELALPLGGFLPLAGATLYRPLSGGLVASFGEGLLSAGEGVLEPRAGGVLLRLGPGEALLGASDGPALHFEEAEIPVALGATPRRVELVERTDEELCTLARRRSAAGQDASYPRMILLKRSSMALVLVSLAAVAVPLSLRWGGRAMPALGVALLTWCLVRAGDGVASQVGAWPAAGLPLLGLAGLAAVLWAGWRDR